MRWQEMLPRGHPLRKEKDTMAMSPGTERAIVELARIAPKLTRELERFNENMERVMTVGEIPGQIGETFSAFKKWLTENPKEPSS